jgi:hypothetical protein
MQAFIHPDVEDDARCLGFVSTFYGNPDFKGTCVIPPYGNALFLSSEQDTSVESSSQMWKVRPVDGAERGTFELIASNKPQVCLRVLAAEDCTSEPTLVEKSISFFKDSKKYTSWKLVKRYDLVPIPPSPSPVAPSPPPVPEPSPAAPVPGPAISANNATSFGYINVIVGSMGGNSECVVSSIVLTSIGNAVGSLPQTVEASASRAGLSSVGVSVPLSQFGYNRLYAIGKCTNGKTTERSNVLSVLYVASSAPTVLPDSVLFSLRYNGLTASSFNQADK